MRNQNLMGQKSNFSNFGKREIRPAAFSTNRTVGLHEGWSGQHFLWRGLADHRTRWPEFEAKWLEIRPDCRATYNLRLSSREADFRSIQGRVRCLRQWARRPSMLEASESPINRARVRPNIYTTLSFKSTAFSNKLRARDKGLLLPKRSRAYLENLESKGARTKENRSFAGNLGGPPGRDFNAPVGGLPSILSSNWRYHCDRLVIGFILV